MKVRAAVLVLVAALTPFTSPQAEGQTGAVLTVANGTPRANGIDVPGDVPIKEKTKPKL